MSPTHSSVTLAGGRRRRADAPPTGINTTVATASVASRFQVDNVFSRTIFSGSTMEVDASLHVPLAGRRRGGA
jgi:hypothetical protein